MCHDEINWNPYSWVQISIIIIYIYYCWFVFHDTLDRLALQVRVMHGWWLSNSDQDRFDMVQLHALCPHIWASTLYDIWEHVCILSSSISPTQLRKTQPTSPPEKTNMASDYLTLRKTTGPHATPRASSRQVEEPKAFSEFLASRRCGGFLGAVKRLWTLRISILTCHIFVYKWKEMKHKCIYIYNYIYINRYPMPHGFV